MTVITPDTTWVNRNNGRRCTVDSTWNDGLVEQVKVCMEEGRCVDFPRPEFLRVFAQANPDGWPNEGETWSLGWTPFKVVKMVEKAYVIVCPSTGFVDTSKPSVFTIADFTDRFKFGEIKRPLPKWEGTPTAVYIPVWEGGEDKSEERAIRSQGFFSPEEIRDKKPWRCLGIVRVPLDYDKAEWTEWPK